MGDEFATQREFDRFVKTTDEAIAQLRADRDDDIKAAVALAVAEAFKELGESRNTSWMRRIGAVGAGAAVVSAWVVLWQVMSASGR